ncbi:hypothetical protein V8G54_021870 [Vigna mungo]|uniref:Non-specific serine/threonine protein kinase n=1 Tax=Vigna mungo TaxID=3915 RepID=A0AAQ3RXS2_VIGMU
MPSLTHLALPLNPSLTGQFPSFILECHNLTYLDISQNGWNGTIPESFYSNLGKLEYLNLSNNGFGGKLSPNLSMLSNLKELPITSLEAFLDNLERVILLWTTSTFQTTVSQENCHLTYAVGAN